MAPVAGGVANGEKDRLVFTLGALKGLISPWQPLHGIKGVLKKVGAFFVNQAVFFFASGLLLFTNDGELAHRLMHPKYRIDREYAVRVFGQIDQDALRRMRDGVDIDGERFRLEDVVEGDGSGANRWFYCVVRQGRNREVRQLWESQGVQVSRLVRVRFGNIILPRELKTGKFFDVEGEVLNDLYRLVAYRPNAVNRA